MIFAHNHPSGIAEPSRADDILVQALKQALAVVDVRVLLAAAGATSTLGRAPTVRPCLVPPPRCHTQALSQAGTCTPITMKCVTWCGEASRIKTLRQRCVTPH